MKIFFSLFAGSALLAVPLQADPFTEAKVTQKVNQVSLVGKQKSTPAAIGDTVRGETAVKTGANSRAELQFPDLTITRLGADTLFSFTAGGRNMDLEEGTMLFGCPKHEGGGQVVAGAVTAAVTGTHFLFSRFRNGDVKLVVLEGHVFLFFTKNPSVRREFKAGDLVYVPIKAGDIPKGEVIDLKKLIETSRLLDGGGFKPIRNQQLLTRIADLQQGHLHRTPDGVSRTDQTAQTARNTQDHSQKPPSPPTGNHSNPTHPSIPPPLPPPTPAPRPTPPPGPTPPP